MYRWTGRLNEGGNENNDDNHEERKVERPCRVTVLVLIEEHGRFSIRR